MATATMQSTDIVKTAPSAQGDELAFRPSPETSLGVELELQILDKETGDLAPGAVGLLKACAEEAIDGVSAELMQSMIEVKTGVCSNVTEVQGPSIARAPASCSPPSVTSASRTGWPG
jgi:hypothetical protein